MESSRVEVEVVVRTQAYVYIAPYSEILRVRIFCTYPMGAEYTT